MQTKRLYTTKIPKTVVGLLCLGAVASIVCTHLGLIGDSDLQYMDFSIETPPRNQDGACSFPRPDPFSPLAMKYHEQLSTVHCDGKEPLTFYEGTRIYVNKTAVKKNKFNPENLKCWYRPLMSRWNSSEFTWWVGDWVGPFSESIGVKDNPEIIEAECNHRSIFKVSSMFHFKIDVAKRERNRPAKHRFSDGEMNVLLLGMDSLSSAAFQRGMNLTRNYMLDDLGAVEMTMFNKVGLNTLPNLFSLMTGKHYSNPGPRGHVLFDDYTFLWDVFKKKGYRTQYVSDIPDFRQFKKQPTDSFSLLLSKALNRLLWDPFVNDCFDSVPDVTIWLDYILEFMQESVFSVGRFFSFDFINRPTHNFPQSSSSVDAFYADFIKRVHNLGLLNNTLFIFFSDHGLHSGRYRYTYQGTLEFRSPVLLMYVPVWFREKYPDLYQNLLTNRKRLMTVFDIRKTLLDIAHSTNIRSWGKQPDIESRGLNLFHELPADRNCEMANIPVDHCLCYQGTGVGLPSEIKLAQRLGHHVVDTINTLLKPRKDLCAKVSFKSVSRLRLLAGTLKKNALYRIVVVTSPGNATFEVTIRDKISLWVFSSLTVQGDVNRLDTYKGLSDCVENDPLYRTMCYCRDVLVSRTSRSLH